VVVAPGCISRGNMLRTAVEDGLHRRRTVMTNREPLTITLRARWSGGDPTPGTLLASPKGRVVYRILEVWRVRRAGDHRYGFRLICARLSRGEVPEGAEVLPWPRDPRAPRDSSRPRRLPRPSADPGPPEPSVARLAPRSAD
jgi:hypothetical protein